MKILVCSCGFNTFRKQRVDLFQMDQAKALRDKGHDVRIITLDLRSLRRFRSPFTVDFFVDGIKATTVNALCGPVPCGLLTYIGKKCAKKAFKRITKDGWIPDIIHAHFTDIACFFSDVAVENGIPYVITEHSSLITKDDIDEKTLFQANDSYKKADAIIAVSSHLADIIFKKFKIKPIVIPNIVDLAVFQKCNIGGAFENKKFTYITAAHLNYGKGMDILLEAFSRLNYSDVNLYIFGDGTEKRALVQQSHRLGVDDKVVFFGAYTREQLSDALHKANCFVLASRGETFGVVYIEAMAAGVPVIATRCGGPQGFINEDCGLLVDVDDVDQLAEAMRYMYKNAKKYHSKKISDFAAKKFSASAVSNELESIFSKIIGKKTNIN